MPDLEETIAGIVVGIIGGMAVAKLVDYLTQNQGSPKNVYQVGVGTQTAASVVGVALNKLAEANVVRTIGDKSDPDTVRYELSQPIES